MFLSVARQLLTYFLVMIVNNKPNVPSYTSYRYDNTIFKMFGIQFDKVLHEISTVFTKKIT